MDVLKKIENYYSEEDGEFLKAAYSYAEQMHRGQKRASGEPYFSHPCAVAEILVELGMDMPSIAAAFLHDVVEDTPATEEDINRKFGKEIMTLVDGVTKLDKIHFATHEEEDAENFRKIFVAMANDVRVIIIKLADRLHNMRSLNFLSNERQQRIARETLEIFTPLAGRLGISQIKCELEDLCLKYLDPEAYEFLVKNINLALADRKRFVDFVVDQIKQILESSNFTGEVFGRPKHFYSIYKKMKNQDKTLDQIYDLTAVRVIVKSIDECYELLGKIHNRWKPVPGRIKDYIATPKRNMYQSLHTTVVTNFGQFFEIQIRTEEMHKMAEYGIAAHWKYKEASDGKVSTGGEDEKLTWLSQILEWQQDMSDNKEFMKLLKSDLDLFSDHVYCFTPAGDVKNLPAGSTPIDFAYSVHSAVGNKMIGARVNGKLVTIDYQISNGDCIEIMTSQNSKGPSRDWLNIVKSAQAKNKISQWFKSEFKEENIIKGRELLQNYCKSKNINIIEILKAEFQKAVMHKYGFNDWDAVLAAIGHGALKEGQVINRMQELYARAHKKQETDEELLAAIQENSANRQMKPKSKTGITVKGIHDVAVRFSRCCAPVPGDEIVGFVTRGRGVSIHRTDCINIMSLSDIDRSRLIDAEWQPEAAAEHNEKYLTEIVIYAQNRHGLLADITKALSEKNIDIRSVNTRTNKQDIATIGMTFEIGCREELQMIVDKLKTIKNVIDIERTTG